MPYFADFDLLGQSYFCPALENIEITPLTMANNFKQWFEVVAEKKRNNI